MSSVAGTCIVMMQVGKRVLLCMGGEGLFM